MTEQEVEFVALSQTCPVRTGDGSQVVQNAKDEDRWCKTGNDLTCSYCGSWKPEEFLEFLPTIDGLESSIELTDRRDKLRFRRKGVSNAGDGAIKIYIAHLRGAGKKVEMLINEKMKLSSDKLRERFERPIPPPGEKS